MSMRKARNAARMWATEGYDVCRIRHKATTNSTPNHVLELTLFLKDGVTDSSIDLYEHRTKIKELARRQSFLEIPLADKNDDGESEVLLVNRLLIYNMKDYLKELVDEHKQSYWYLQAHKDYKECVDLLEGITSTLSSLYKLINLQSNKHDREDVRELHDRKETMKVYESFKVRFRTITDEMAGLKVIDKALINKQLSYASLYG